MDVTVCTLTRNRSAHLMNQIRGLLGSTRHPVAHVIAVMGGDDPRSHVPPTPWETRFVDVEGAGELPLAAARNAAVAASTTPGVVLLDVDCIPSRTLVASYAGAMDRFDGILMGGVRYLPAAWEAQVGVGTRSPDAPPSWEDATLHQIGERHPSRPEPPNVAGTLLTDAYELFWSLSFAIRRDTMLDRIGGFDSGYGGYGGEDTDFAFRARDAGVPLAWAGQAWAFHQHHDTYDPPVQHVASVLENARRFRDVWGCWPMEGWLKRFAELGLMRWDPDSDELEFVREPTNAELRAAYRPTAVPRADTSSS